MWEPRSFFSPFDNSLEFVCGVNRFEPHFIRIANGVLYANRRFGENARHIVEYRTHQIKRTNVFVLAIWYWVWNRICVCTIWVICLYAMALVTNRCILSRSHVMYAKANLPNWSSATAIQSQVYTYIAESESDFADEQSRMDETHICLNLSIFLIKYLTVCRKNLLVINLMFAHDL